MVSAARFLLFGPYRFDEVNRLLLREDTEVPLPPRVLSVLECLLQRPGDIVSRQELIQSVWPDAFVTDTSLAEAVSFLRQALGDDPQAPRYVQTIPRRGYRFVAAVEATPAVKVADVAMAAITTNPTEAGAAPVSIGRTLAPWSLAVLLAATLVVTLWRLTHPQATSQPRLTRFELAMPTGTWLPITANAVAVSADGGTFAFPACTHSGCRLHVRDLGAVAPRALEDTGGAAAPFFSPDGAWLGFFAEGKLKKIALGGGRAVAICDAADPLGAAWLDDGRIVFAGHANGGLDVVSENGGPPAPMTRVDPSAGEVGHRWPHWLPGTDQVLFTSITHPTDRGTDRAVAFSRTNGHTQVLAGRATAARLIAPEVLLFVRGTDLQAARFDAVRGVLSTAPIRAGGDVSVAEDGSPLFAASAQGTLLLVPGPATAARTALWTTDTRHELSVALASLREPALDRQALRLAGVHSDGVRCDLWVGDAARGTVTRLTHDHPAASPVWHPDGRHIVFSTSVDGPFNLWIADADVPSSRRFLSSRAHQFASSITASGSIVFTQIDAATRGDIWIADPGGHARVLVATPFDERDGAMAPDGRWLAYLSDESGQWQVYVKPIGGDRRYVASPAGAGRAWWLRDGRLVYRTADGGLGETPMSADGPGTPGSARRLGDGSVLAVSEAGAILLERPRPPLPAPIVAIEAWREISRALPPALTNLPR